MSMVSLPGLKTKSKSAVSATYLVIRSISAQEALLKGYERYRRAQSLDKRHFDEEYFDNFEVELDVEEGLSRPFHKTIVERSQQLRPSNFTASFRKLLPRLSWETLLF